MVAAERRLGARRARPLAWAAKRATPALAHESACKDCHFERAVRRRSWGQEAPLFAVPPVVPNSLTRSRPDATPPQATGAEKRERRPAKKPAFERQQRWGRYPGPPSALCPSFGTGGQAFERSAQSSPLRAAPPPRPPIKIRLCYPLRNPALLNFARGGGRKGWGGRSGFSWMCSATAPCCSLTAPLPLLVLRDARAGQTAGGQQQAASGHPSKPNRGRGARQARSSSASPRAPR